MIYIFIRNKLISCDSILPVALELFEEKGIRSTFITFDKKTYNTIKKNYFISDTINKIGYLKYVGKTNSKIRSRLYKIFFLVLTALRSVMFKTYFIHFGHLNSGVIGFLTKFNKSSRIFFCETDASGFSKFMFKVDYCRRDYEFTIKNEKPPTKGSLLHFGKEWAWLEDSRVKKLPRYYHRLPRERSSWKNYVIQNSAKYLSPLEIDKPIIFYIITGFCHLDIIRDENTTRNKFRETLKILTNECPDYTILIKPHPISNINEVKEILKEFPTLDTRISYLHPSILGYAAKMTICNFYSTASYDSTLFDVPVIEFTDYCDAALKVSKNRSQRYEYVTHFIQNDPNEFIKVLKKYNQVTKTMIQTEQQSPESDFIRLF